MNSLLDFIYQLIVHPQTALYSVTAGEKLQTGFLVWIFTVFILSLSSFVEGPGIVLGFLICFLGAGMSLFIHSALIDYIAGLLGGRGTAKGITAGFMASFFPYAFMVFAALFSHFPGGGLLHGLVVFILFIWTWVLDVIAISQNYSFSLSKSFAVACIPYAAAAAFLLCFFLAGIAAAVMGLSQMTELEQFGTIMQQI